MSQLRRLPVQFVGEINSGSTKSEPLGFDPMTLDPEAKRQVEDDRERNAAGAGFHGRNERQSLFPQFAERLARTPPFRRRAGIVSRLREERPHDQQTSNTYAPTSSRRRNTPSRSSRMKGQSANAGMPQGLYPDSQIVVTLK